jgi:hypothetical protein
MKRTEAFPADADSARAVSAVAGWTDEVTFATSLGAVAGGRVRNNTRVSTAGKAANAATRFALILTGKRWG